MAETNELKAEILEEVAACSCDTAEDTKWALNRRAEALRSSSPKPETKADGVELWSVTGGSEEDGWVHERNTAAEAVVKAANEAAPILRAEYRTSDNRWRDPEGRVAALLAALDQQGRGKDG